MSIIDIVEKLTRKYKTNDPFEIAKLKNIQIHLKDLKELRDMYYYYKRNKQIFINSTLTYEEQKLVCAHELGHAILHPKFNIVFLESNTFITKNKFEIEANSFAAELLVGEEKPLEGETIEEFAARMELPVEIITLWARYNNLIN